MGAYALNRPDDPTGAKFVALSDGADDINVAQFLATKNPKDQEAFRIFNEENSTSRGLYLEQHTKQTLQYNIDIRQKVFAKPRATMGIWEAMELLNKLVDESDPDTDATQIEHLLQTAESMRQDGAPDWMICTGLVHDLGKLLYFFGSEGQWDVVGDTMIVGCAFPTDKIVYGKTTFQDNPDCKDPILSSKFGIYEPNCGLDNVMISWGHDEYMYLICAKQSYLPKQALNMIRLHSLYPHHRENAYEHLMNADDYEALKDVLAFNPYDLYSKSDSRPNIAELRPYYEKLIAKFFPEKIDW